MFDFSTSDGRNSLLPTPNILDKNNIHTTTDNNNINTDTNNIESSNNILIDTPAPVPIRDRILTRLRKLTQTKNTTTNTNTAVSDEMIVDSPMPTNSVTIKPSTTKKRCIYIYLYLRE